MILFICNPFVALYSVESERFRRSSDHRAVASRTVGNNNFTLLIIYVIYKCEWLVTNMFSLFYISLFVIIYHPKCMYLLSVGSQLCMILIVLTNGVECMQHGQCMLLFVLSSSIVILLLTVCELMRFVINQISLFGYIGKVHSQPLPVYCSSSELIETFLKGS